MTIPRYECDNKECRHLFNRELLECPECGTKGVTKLYKYRDFSCPFTVQSLVDRTVWFPKAMEVDDPHEFSFRLKENCFQGQPIDLNSLETAHLAMKENGIYCLSESPTIWEMWNSSYGGFHSGICLEFLRTETNDLKPSQCVPVIYHAKTPVFEPNSLLKKSSKALS